MCYVDVVFEAIRNCDYVLFHDCISSCHSPYPPQLRIYIYTSDHFIQATTLGTYSHEIWIYIGVCIKLCIYLCKTRYYVAPVFKKKVYQIHRSMNKHRNYGIYHVSWYFRIIYTYTLFGEKTTALRISIKCCGFNVNIIIFYMLFIRRSY